MLFWVLFRKEHFTTHQSSPESIYLPNVLSFIFMGKEGLHNRRGILGQLTILGIDIVYILRIFDFIAEGKVARSFLLSILLVLAVYLLILVLFRNR